MAQRYGLQIQERPAPAAFERNPVDGAATGVQAGRAIQGLGGAVQDMSAMLVAREDRQANYDAMAALRDYKRGMMAYLNDPDTGAFNTRKLGNARGLAGDVDRHADDLAMGLRKGLSARAAEKFGLIEQEARMPFVSESSKFEAAQGREYEEMTFQSSLAECANAVAAMPYSADVFDSAAREGVLAIGVHMQGAPDAAVRLAQRGYVSGLEAGRIAAVAVEDPISAKAMTDASDVLLPKDRAALKKSIEPQAEQQEGRAIAEQVLGMFGGEYDAAAGIAWIRQNVQDDDIADIAVREYSGFIREKNLAYTLEDQRQQEMQRQNADQFIMDYALGSPHPTNEIVQKVESGELSASAGAQLIARNDSLADYGMTLQGLKKTPGWNTLSEHQQDMLTMTKIAGTTPEIHAAAVGLLNEGLTTGETDAAAIKDFVSRGLITREEGRRFNASLKGFNDANKKAVAGIISEFTARMNPVSNKNPELYGKYSSDFFFMKKMELDAYAAELAAAGDPDIVEKVGARARILQNEIIEEIYKDTSQRETDEDKHWFSDPTPTPFAKEIAAARKGLEDIVRAGTGIKPKPVKAVEMADVNLPPSANIASALPSSMRKRNVIGIYGGTVSNAAQEFGVPEALAWALITWESNGSQAAVSDKGAIGLMQLMPDTARGLGVDPHDPHQNIRGGVKYIGSLLKKYGGNVGAALSHYNGGGNNAQAYLKRGRPSSDETAKFVPGVMALYKKYDAALHAAPLAPPATATPAPVAAQPPAVASGDLTIDQFNSLPEREKIKHIRWKRENR
jgi:soluble lytic murein transglycosylase-like protein